MVSEGQQAPDFKLKGLDEKGKQREYTLKGSLGKKLILYFYPRDNTPGCTTEACDFRDNMNRIAKKGLTVLGVSPDSLDSHRNFKEKHGLGFPLLSDPEKSVAEKYGAYGEKVMYGKVSKGIIRSTFLIDEKGTLEKAWRNVKAKGHVEEILKALGD
jgi:peroxiredoxin Q/BCP